MMTNLTVTLSPALATIVKPYQFCDSDDELLYYNTTLSAQIAKIQVFIESASAEEGAIAASWARKLQHQIETNIHYVSYRKSLNSSFSVYFCAATNDVVGMRYLLRTGANPNEMQNVKSAIHIAVAKGLLEIVKLLKKCPALNLQLKTRTGKTALQLAVSEELKRELSA